MRELSQADAPAELPPFEFVEQRSPDGILLICDHASQRILPAYGDLGVDPEALKSHVAWDIGAGDLTRRLAALLGAGAVLAGVSRLVIDCNRPPGHETSIPVRSHGFEVPGNQGLPPGDVQAREQHFFHPYQAAVDRELTAIEAAGMRPALVSVHSFTPFLDEYVRPWHIGILSDRDRRLAELLLAELEGQPDLLIGDNEPYSGTYPEGYSCRHHGDAMGRANVLIEVRQDLVDNPGGVGGCAELLAPRIARAAAALRDADAAARQKAR